MDERLPRKNIGKIVLVLLFFASLLYPVTYSLAGKSEYVLVFGSIFLLFLWVVVYIVKHKKKIFIDRPLFYLVGGFFLLHFITLFWAKESFFINLWYLMRFCLGLVAFLYAYFSVENKKDLADYLKIFLFIVIAESLLLIFQRLTLSTVGVIEQGYTAAQDYLLSNQHISIPESGGTYVNANYLVNWQIYGFFILLALILVYKKKSLRLSATLFFIVLLISLILSLSRSGWLAVIIGGIVFVAFCWNYSKSGRKVASVILLVLTLITVLFIYSNFSDVFQQKIIPRTSVKSRAVLRQIGIDILTDYPFTGVGIDRTSDMKEYYDKYKKQLKASGLHIRPLEAAPAHMGLHNTYLKIAAEGGLIALILFLLIGILIIRRMIKLVSRIKGREGWLALGLMSAFCGHLVIIYWIPSVTFTFLWPLFWFLIGLAGALYKLCQQN